MREAATRHAQGKYETLFGQEEEDFPLSERFAVAAKVSLHTRPTPSPPTTPDLALPAGVAAADPGAGICPPADLYPNRGHAVGPLQALALAGWSLRAVVTLAQLIAFVSFQSRLIAGCGC